MGRPRFMLTGLGALVLVGACGDGRIGSTEQPSNTVSSSGSGSGNSSASACTPGEERVCVCYGIPNGSQYCNEAGTGFSDCPTCTGDGGSGGAGAGPTTTSSSSDPCAEHCDNSVQDCGETGLDCGGTCQPCPPPFYAEEDCIKAARNGSEICDDAAWKVQAPGNDLVLVCLTDAGGIIYVSTNTGPPDPVDKIKRCQGWEKNQQNAWDNLNYLYQHTCKKAQELIELDLSGHVGQTLYFGAHNHPKGGGQFTHMCLAKKK